MKTAFPGALTRVASRCVHLAARLSEPFRIIAWRAILSLLLVPAPNAFGFQPEITEAKHALRFSGSQHVRISQAPDFNVTTEITLEAWINVAAFDREEHAIITKGSQWGLLVRATSNQNPGRRVVFRTRNGNADDDLANTSDLTAGRWYHVAAVKTSTQKSIYIDGVLSGSKNYSIALPVDTWGLHFGAQMRNQSPINFYSGLLDTVRIWSKARTQDQIEADRGRDLYGDEEGLLGEWRFNEPFGQTVFDSSIGKRDGFLQGMTEDDRIRGIKFDAPPPRATVARSALLFDGSGTESVIVDGSASGFGGITDKLTIEAWVNLDAPTDVPRAIVSKGDAWALEYTGASPKLRLSTKTGAAPVILTGQTTLLPGRWYHVAAVYDGSRKQLYVDGKPDGPSQTASGNLAQDTAPVVFGGKAGTVNGYLDGTLDSVRIWSAVRSVEQLKENLGRNLRGSEPGLMGEWRFNEGEGLDALDASYEEHHGSLEGMTNDNRVNGLALAPAPPPLATEEGEALRFRGGPPPSEPRVEITEEGAFDLTEGLTLEAWVKIEEWDKPWQVLVGKGDAWALTRFGETGQIAFRTHLGFKASDLSSAQTLARGRWYHIAAVVDGVQKRLYIDGVLDASVAFTGPLIQNDVPVVLGADGGQRGRAFNGTLDTVRIWSVPRTAAEIEAHLNRNLRGTEPGLLGDWRFNETGPAALDSSFNHFDGILKDLVEPDVRTFGLLFRDPADGELALRLDQSATAAQYVALPDASLPLFQGSFTIEFWVHFDDWLVDRAALVSKGTEAWAVDLLPSGKIQFHTQGLFDSEGDSAPNLISSGALDRRTWHHVAVTWDAALMEKSLFIDGSKDTSASNLFGAIGSNDRPVHFGFEPGLSAPANGARFDGVLDEVRIWTMARAAERIQASYTRKVNGTEPGLIGVWSMNEGSGVVAANGAAATGAALDGLLRDEMSSLNRVEGQALGEPLDEQFALTLDGTDDFVGIAHHSTLDLCPQANTSATLEAWIRPSSLLRPADISNLAALFTKLTEGAGPPAVLSRHISETLAPKDQPLPSDAASLASALNRLIQGPSLYQAERFVGVTLRPETLELTKTVLSGAAVRRLNRLLLEDAYIEISRQNARWQTIISKGAAGYGLAMDGDRYLRVHLGSTGNEGALRSSQKIPFDVWSHVAVAITRTASGATVMLYVQGQPAGDHSVTSWSSVFNNSDPLFLGKRGTPGADFFQGQLDEVRVWNVLRSALNIDLFATRELPLGGPGLVGYWQFNAGSGTAIVDSTFQGRDGVLNGDSGQGWADGQPVAEDTGLLLNLQPNPSSRGLWIGQVTLAQVNEVHARNKNDSDTLTDAPDAAAASLRIILHVDAQGTVRLLKDVMVMATGPSAAQPNAAIQPVLLTDPRRIPEFQGIVTRGGKRVGLRHGTAAYDFAGFELPLAGGLGPGAACMGKINVPADHPTNPFRHRYHPEHRSGYDIAREISIQFATAEIMAAAGDGPGYGVERLTGYYRETVTGLHKIPIKAAGMVTLHRISDVGGLNGLANP